jgi:hypothetical protein
MSKLCGTLFVFCGNKFDYCYKEAIKCLLEFCDHVIVAAGGDDNTYEDILPMVCENLALIKITQEQWDEQHGREKLNHFTNICIREAERLGFQWNFNLQADEIVHEKSYLEIRKAIQNDREGFMCRRINLWKSPYLKLDVPQERKPCSTSIIRLCKSQYRSVDDAENIAVPLVELYYEAGIKIYHMGFVRKREVMKGKIINMQVGVFEMADYDNKLKDTEVFNPDLWFGEDDLKPIDEPLPKLIQQWAKERYYED